MLPILNQLKAETILHGTDILPKIDRLRASFTYKTEQGGPNGDTVSFEDYYRQLARDASDVEQIQLQASVPPGTAQKYLIDLTQALQLVTDKLENIHSRALFFMGKLNSAIHNRDNLSATFCVWYQVAVMDTLKSLEIKIPNTTIKALAESEFSRLLNEEDQILDGMKAAVEVLIDHLKNSKKLAMEKYKIGTDQANSSIVRMPNQAYGDGSEPLFPLLQAKYGMKPEVPAKPKYDDEDEPDTVPIETEKPEYVQHREVPSTAPGVFKTLDAVIKHHDIGAVSEEEFDEAKTKFRQSLSDSVVDLEEEDHGTIVLEIPEKKDIPCPVVDSNKTTHDPFLGDFQLKTNEEGEVKVVTKKNRVFDDEEEAVPAEPTTKKTRPKYDDEEEEEPVAIETKPLPETKPAKKERKKISFDQPF
jgi:hypothetical protein